MKKLILIFTVLLTIASCKKGVNENILQNKTTDNTFVSDNTIIDGVKFPNGTSIQVGDDLSLKITLPEGFQMLGINGDDITYIVNATYNCSCSSSGGCDTIKAKGQYGCAHGSCTGSCTGRFVDSDGGTQGTGPFFDPNNVVVVRISDNEVKPITSIKKLDMLDYAPNILLDALEPQLKEYANNIYGNNSTEALNHVANSNSNESNIDDIIFVFMEVYGYSFIYGISTTHLLPSAIEDNGSFPVVNTTSQCDCTSGSSGCSEDNSFGLLKCAGGSCSSCSLSGSVLYNGNEYKF